MEGRKEGGRKGGPGVERWEEGEKEREERKRDAKL